MKLAVALAGCMLLGVSAAQATTTIVNLNASATSPNAGKSSGGYAYNPVTISLAAGSYSVGVIGQSSGGLYNAYSVYADNGSNSAYTDSMWSLSLNNGATAAYTQTDLGRTNTAASALALYSAASPYVFTLASAQSVSLYVDDTVLPYFGDNSGGVSLAVNSVASSVPEPASLLLLGFGTTAAVAAVRRRRLAV